jgi:hypothetical protein
MTVSRSLPRVVSPTACHRSSSGVRVPLIKLEQQGWVFQSGRGLLKDTPCFRRLMRAFAGSHWYSLAKFSHPAYAQVAGHSSRRGPVV